MLQAISNLPTPSMAWPPSRRHRPVTAPPLATGLAIVLATASDTVQFGATTPHVSDHLPTTDLKGSHDHYTSIWQRPEVREAMLKQTGFKGSDNLLPNGAKVMDVGCWYGHLALEMAAARPDIKVSAIDKDEAPPSALAQTAWQLGITNLSAYKQVMPRKQPLRQHRTDPFDLIVASNVFQNTWEIYWQTQLLALKRSLKVGGKLVVIYDPVIMVDNTMSQLKNAVEVFTKHAQQTFGADHCQPFTLPDSDGKDLLAAHRKAGLILTNTEAYIGKKGRKKGR